MMAPPSRFLRAACVLLASAIAASAAPAEAPTLTALSQIQSGEWTLSSRDRSVPARRLCLGDPRALLQIRHGGAGCGRFVIANDPRQLVVHYTCPGAGHGRTTVRVESERLIHIDSQGIAENMPFDWSFEGRRTGECSASDRAGLR